MKFHSLYQPLTCGLAMWKKLKGSLKNQFKIKLYVLYLISCKFLNAPILAEKHMTYYYYTKNIKNCILFNDDQYLFLLKNHNYFNQVCCE